MLVSCLLPTFNRFSNHLRGLFEEAVMAFILQDYPDRELIICNDTPNQTLHFSHPQIKVFNLPDRFPRLGNKIQWMIDQAQGEYLCRWDDDDISLPWRLSYSRRMLGQWRHGERANDRPTDNLGGSSRLRYEWRPENHWFDRPGHDLSETRHPGNTHIMAIWHRDILGNKALGDIAAYPGEVCPSGLEDQTFTAQLRKRGYPAKGDLLPLKDIFYIYRWGTGSNHLSGQGGGEVMQKNYENIGNIYIAHGNFKIEPVWQRDYVALARRAAERPAELPVAT